MRDHAWLVTTLDKRIRRRTNPSRFKDPLLTVAYLAKNNAATADTMPAIKQSAPITSRSRKPAVLIKIAELKPTNVIWTLASARAAIRISRNIGCRSCSDRGAVRWRYHIKKRKLIPPISSD